MLGSLRYDNWDLKRSPEYLICIRYQGSLLFLDDANGFIPICIENNTLNIHEAELEAWMLEMVSKDDWKPSWCRCEDCLYAIRQEKEEYLVGDTLEQDGSSNLQKKIMPLTNMFADDDLLTLEDGSDKSSTGIHKGLIVVASLIDKINNLGGLCRSCEIYGVGTYAIEYMKY